MRALIQRVKRASVTTEGIVVGTIGQGLVVLLGLTHDDDLPTVQWMAQKVLSMRIFPDEHGKMNRNVGDMGGGILVVSQFSLYANAIKGRRPNFADAAPSHIAEPLYDEFVSRCSQIHTPVETGRFGADMDVSLVNWGPVTIWLDSEMKPRQR